MKTPCDHSKLTWTSIRAGAVVGAIVVLLCRAALGQTIPNPSFEADTFTVFPGYVGDQTTPTITGWTVDAPEGAGLNPIADGRSPFADNGTIPDGKQVLFIQSGANTSETTVSTTISRASSALSFAAAKLCFAAMYFSRAGTFTRLCVR